MQNVKRCVLFIVMALCVGCHCDDLDLKARHIGLGGRSSESWSGTNGVEVFEPRLR